MVVADLAITTNTTRQLRGESRSQCLGTDYLEWSVISLAWKYESCHWFGLSSVFCDGFKLFRGFWNVVKATEYMLHSVRQFGQRHGLAISISLVLNPWWLCSSESKWVTLILNIYHLIALQSNTLIHWFKWTSKLWVLSICECFPFPTAILAGGF